MHLWKQHMTEEDIEKRTNNKTESVITTISKKSRV